VPELCLSQVADAEVLQYLVEPGEEAMIGPERSDVAIRTDEGLLGQIEGIFSVADQAKRDAIGVFHISVDKGFKRLR
jgi:hypothetical protein